MNRTKRISANAFLYPIVIFLLGSPLVSESYAEKCVGGTPKICVEFINGADPVFLTDFDVIPGSPPSLVLKKGALNWRVWSQVSGGDTTPADFGSITLNPSVPADEFEVEIKNGTTGGAGAVNVGSIVLDDVGFTGYSNLGETMITGNVAGAITLVETIGGVGGEVTGLVIITGNAVGHISIPKVSGTVAIFGSITNAITLDEVSGSFAVSVNASDDITVSTLSGSLTVSSTVPSGKTVTIQELTDTGQVNLGTLEGRLELINGIPSSCPSDGPCDPGSDYAHVAISVLSDTGVIDLNGADMAGTLSVTKGQNNSQIIAGGDVSGFIYPGFGQSGYFNGTLTVSSVSAIGTLPTIPTGEIEAFLGAALNGIVNVSGSVAGVVEASRVFTGQINVGSVAAGGVIEAAQDALGSILISGALLGTVEVVGDLGGSIRTTFGGALGATGKIEVTGALTGTGKIFVHGLCDGAVQIGQQTEASTLIHLFGGLGSTGTVEVNTSRGIFDAGGTIHVGYIAYIFLPDVTYDGCTRIYNDGAGSGGNLTGEIQVFGCHETHDPLNICVDGEDNGNVNIVQTDCIPVVGWSCGTCPPV